MKTASSEFRLGSLSTACRALRLAVLLPLPLLAACALVKDVDLGSAAVLPMSELSSCPAGQACNGSGLDAAGAPAALVPVPQGLVESLPSRHLQSALEASRAAEDQHLANVLERASLPVDRYDLGDGYLADGIIPQ